MKLISLKLKNFKTHVDSEINFENLGSPVLIKGINKDSNGSNGAGKSSIFDAIEYAFYGKNIKYLRNGTDEGLVELKFEKGYHTYVIIKKMYGNGDYDVKLLQDNTEIMNSKSEIEKYIRNILHVSKTLFDQTIFQAQGFNQFFGLLSPKMKSEFILELLEMEKWEKYYEISNILYKTIKSDYESLLSEKNFLEANINELIMDINNKDEKKLNKDLEAKTKMLKMKKDTLFSLNNSKTLIEKKDTLSLTIKKNQETLNWIRREISKFKEEYSKKINILNELKSRKVVAIDDNFRKGVLANALSLEKNLAILRHELQTKKEQLDSFLKTYEKLKTINVCPLCRQILQDKQVLNEYISSEKLKYESEIIELEDKIKRQESLQKDLAAQIEAIEKQYKIYNEHITSMDSLEKEIKVLETNIYELETKKQEIIQIIEPLQKEYDLIKNIDVDNVKEHINILEKDISFMEKEILEINTILNSIKENKNKLEILKVKLEDIQKRINKYSENIKLMEHIKFIFSVNGIQRWLFVNTLNEIANLANSLISSLNFTVLFQMEKKKKTKDDNKPTFDILIKKNKEEKIYPLEVLSGGEKSIIHFAIRLAFSSIMAMKYDFKFLIIDEGFSDMDEKNRELVSFMVYQLASYFQIFLVTHLQDFENFFPNVLLVERENNVSKIKVEK